jgi:hypothetical protein
MARLSRRIGEMDMTIDIARFAALLGISTAIATPIHAHAAPAGKPDAGEYASLAQPATFDVTVNTGSLKETAQKGQQLVWRRKEGSNDDRFQVTKISVAFLRSETGGQLKLTFSGSVSSLGYLTAEEAKLNLIVRAKGGAALHTWTFGMSVKCTDKDQPLTPLTHEVPNDIAANVFTNVGTVEIAEFSEPNYAGVKVQRCS